MTLMDVMERLVEENIPFRFETCYGAQHIYVENKKASNHNGFYPQIRISIEDGQLYRRNCGIVGFIPMDVLFEEIKELM